MAGGIDWFRWHHGSVTDPKFQLVARRADVSLPQVLAVWTYLLEKASAAEFRGCFGEIDCEAVDCLFGMDDGATEAILGAMVDRKLIADEYIVAWEKRQPKRERPEDNSAARTRSYRDRQACSSDATQNQVTPSDATQRQETPRGEERREEQNQIPSLLTQAPAFLPESRPADPPQLALVEPSRPKTRTVPDCPHADILALWAEVLPAMPQHNPNLWRGTRADHLRARWRETAASEGWETESDGLAYLRKLFVFIGRSAFLTGRAKAQDGRPPFVVELAWLVNAQNWAKVIEGKYHTEAA